MSSDAKHIKVSSRVDVASIGRSVGRNQSINRLKIIFPIKTSTFHGIKEEGFRMALNGQNTFRSETTAMTMQNKQNHMKIASLTVFLASIVVFLISLITEERQPIKSTRLK